MDRRSTRAEPRQHADDGWVQDEINVKSGPVHATQTALSIADACTFLLSSIQAWNIKTFHSVYCRFRVPARCSAHLLVIGWGKKKPSDCNRFSLSNSSAHPRSGPRSHSSMGTANPILGLSIKFFGTYLSRTRR